MKAATLLLAIVVLAGCRKAGVAQQSSTRQADADTTKTLAPVETQPPNADYKPAFAGQTRIAGVKTKTKFAFNAISSHLDRPWGIAPLPDSRLLISEKEGTMRIATPNGALSEKILGIPKVNPQGQGGLLGVTLDPGFQTNRLIYWAFAEDYKNGTLTAVGKGRLSDDEKRIENAKVIYRAIPSYDGTLHYGGRVMFDKTGHLLLSTGERSDIETRPQAQSLGSALGKVIRITVDGQPAADNPFIGNKKALPEIFTYGHRNVQGLAIHPKTGDIWQNEFGPRGGDEINLLRAGKNYGWPEITYGVEYSGKEIGKRITQRDGMEQPIYYWDPVSSPSGMTFYNGSEIPEWQNDLFIGGLSSTHIIRLVIKNNRVTGEERLLENERQRFRDVCQGHDGSLYAITDEGRLYRIGKPK